MALDTQNQREWEINCERNKNKKRALLRPEVRLKLSHSMLYPTHHLLFFHHFKTTTTPTTSPHLSLPPPSLQVEQGMECVEGALKSSFRPDMVVKKTHHPQAALLDDIWTTANTQNEDFFVDDLLDFSKDEFFAAEEEEETQNEKVADPCSVSQSPVKEVKETTEKNNKASSDPCTELTIPAEDMADLEWLSHFVEDSFSEYSLTCPLGKLPVKPAVVPEVPVPKQSTFATPVQTKARSKRARTGFRVWSLGSSSLTESSSTTSSSSSTSSTTQSNPWLIYASPGQTADSFLRPPPPAAKKPKQRKQGLGTGVPQQQQQPRRCSHCLVQKTPQWRAGPLGPKTLCNACGVRYKSGRLLPEYRPACSPTFSSEVHSNNHRKVMEMRRQKETVPELTQPVQSFESKILVG